MATKHNRLHSTTRQVYKAKHQASRTAQRHGLSAERKTIPATRIILAENQLPDQLQADDYSSYEATMVQSILGNGVKYVVPNEAFMFGAVIASLSPATKDLQYRAGMGAGRSLYRTQSSSHGYMFPEESVADLTSFLEASGYRYVTYAAFPDQTEISMFDRKGPHVATDLHRFEAGLISGFLSSAYKRVIEVTETECVHNGAKCCKFSSVPQRRPVSGSKAADATYALNALAAQIAETTRHPARHTGWAMSEGFSSEYYSLLSKGLFSKENAQSINTISAYLGVRVGRLLSENVTGRARLDHVLRAMGLLHFGTAVIRSRKPLWITIRFDRLYSGKEFVDAALSFIGGLVSSTAAGASPESRIVTSERVSAGAHVVELSERPNKSK